MRPTSLGMALALFLTSAPGFAQGPVTLAAATAPSPAPLTLQEALTRAAQANPSLRAKKAQLATVEGVRTEARALLYNNPQLSLENTQRQVPQPGTGDDMRREWGVGLAQTFEIAGQGRHRRESADAALAALRLEIADTERQVRGDAASRFYRVLALQQRVDLETEALKLFDDAAVAMQQRRRAGEDTKLDANVASVEAERARNQLAQVQEQLDEARTELAARLQLDSVALPLANGDLTPTATKYALNDLLNGLPSQPRLLALTERERSANARLRLENASAFPDITVGLNIGREGPIDARERLTTLSVSVPLPLFKRNAAGIGQAATEATQAQIERETAQRDSRANVASLWTRLSSQAQRVHRLQESVVPALADNQSLSFKSRQAGQIGLLEMIVVNRQALDARRDLIEALTDYHTTRIALELAAGWPHEGN